jgi:hypothetical protein
MFWLASECHRDDLACMPIRTVCPAITQGSDSYFNTCSGLMQGSCQLTVHCMSSGAPCTEPPPLSLASASGRLTSAAGAAQWQSYPGPECLLRRRRWLRSRHRAVAGVGSALLQQAGVEGEGGVSRADGNKGAGTAEVVGGAHTGAQGGATVGPVAPAPGAMHAGDGMALVAVVLCTLLRGTRLTESKVRESGCVSVLVTTRLSR